MKNLLKLVLVTLAVGCGGTEMDQAEVQTETLATHESALVQCGLSCPSGYYVAGQNCSATCGSCAASPNQVVCNPIPTSGSINPCGSTCPSGWTRTSTTCNSSCWTCYSPSFTNSALCTK
ncbi:hypothetical protein JRI60_09200 [Archangium violaceum]|uniref:hypothetical protein n=1 Tax=Archangium violaceum TaxID=83451 RepID=UPI0019501AB5|nr:hypothetical protein [Archangium violaceum]QRN99174.1 hypothetical protein JRI60_09200 [Archangium violaceum]